jgi:hypothetical protein
MGTISRGITRLLEAGTIYKVLRFNNEEVWNKELIMHLVTIALRANVINRRELTAKNIRVVG